jgi:hypothetical protein
MAIYREALAARRGFVVSGEMAAVGDSSEHESCEREDERLRCG